MPPDVPVVMSQPSRRSGRFVSGVVEENVLIEDEKNKIMISGVMRKCSVYCTYLSVRQTHEP